MDKAEQFMTISHQPAGSAAPTRKFRDFRVIGFALTLVVLVIGGVLGFVNYLRLAENDRRVARAHEVIEELENLATTLTDAEAAQRGYLLTEDEQYLKPYNDALLRLQGIVAQLKKLSSNHPDRETHIGQLEPKIQLWLEELKRPVGLEKSGDRPAALTVVRSDAGNTMMDGLRKDVVALQTVEQESLLRHAADSATGSRTTILSILLPTLLGLGLVIAVFVLSQRNQTMRQRAIDIVAEQGERLRTTLASIGDAVVTTDTSCRVTGMNAVAESLTGWTTADAIGVPLDTVFRIVNEQSRQPVESPATRALREGLIVGLANHTVLICKNGTERPIDDSAAPIRCRLGEIVGCVLVFRDVTQRRQEEIAQAERTRLTSLRAEIATALASDSPTHATLRQCAEALVRHLDVAFARIWTLDQGGGVLELQASAGLYTHTDGPHRRINVGEFKIGRIASSRQPHVTNDVPNDPNVSDPEWAAREGMVAFAGYPLLVEDRVYGVVALFARRSVSEAMLTDLAPLADQIAQYVDRKRSEDNLRASEEFNRSLMDGSVDCVKVLDLDGRLLQMNEPGLCSMEIDDFGPFCGASWVELWPTEAVGDIANAVAAARAGATSSFQAFCPTAKGTPRWWDVTVSPVRGTQDGSVVRLLAVSRDITDRKRAEEQLREGEKRFRTLADNMSQFAWMADDQGYIFWYNRRWYEYTGTTLEQMQGWGWRDVHHPDHIDGVVKRIQHSWDTGEPWEDTFPLRGVNGGYRWFLSRAVPIRGDHGQVVCWFGTNTDITEQRELEQALRESDLKKNEFLSILAHELRNPLAPIRNGLQLMKLETTDAEVADSIRSMMERQLGQMVRLIDDLMDLTRISQGKMDLQKARLPISTAVRNAVDTSRPLFEAANHTLTLDLPDEPIDVDADETRLSQVFANLLNNAAKYTEPGGLIRVAIQRAGSDVVVSVEDNGIGIPAAMLPQVFDIFTQVDRSLEKAQGGLGIGLSIVKRLVEMHGGSIVATSPGQGQGSCFVVRLPVSPAITAATEKSIIDTKPKPVVGRRILVVDDNVDGARSLAMMLKIMGNQTQTAHNGLEAIALAETFRPEVILMDIGMPKLNGYQACRHIREQPWGRNLIMVAQTGWGQDDDKRKSQNAGFNFHMVKPIDPTALTTMLAGLSETADDSRSSDNMTNDD